MWPLERAKAASFPFGVRAKAVMLPDFCPRLPPKRLKLYRFRVEKKSLSSALAESSWGLDVQDYGSKI